MRPTFNEFVTSYKDKLLRGLEHLDLTALESALDILTECRDAGGTVYLCGNGGSAALASHMATDLQLAGVRAISLTDISAVTTYANDVSFRECFIKQLELLLQERDVVILISGSGNSDNLIVAAACLKNLASVSTIAITGMTGGELARLAPTLHIHCPAVTMGPSQDLHQIVLHLLTYRLIQEKWG